MAFQRTRRPSLRSGRSLCSLGSPLNAYPLGPLTGALARHLLGLALFSLSAALAADSLVSASTTDFYSADRTFRLRVEPSPTGVRVTLSKRGVLSIYVAQWTSSSFQPPLFPSSGFVTDDGRFAALVVGYLPQSDTRNALGIFGPGGELVRAMSLDDLFSSEEKPRLVRSVSGIPWVGAVKLIPRTSTLRIVTNDPFSSLKKPPGAVIVPTPLVVTLFISLPTGRVSRLAGGA